MGQIVKRKKKGRPSKADLARRAMLAAKEEETEVRRSLRRRNVRYDIDYYEEYFDDEDDDDEEERRREKKLKLVLKLNQGCESTEPARSRSRSLSRVEYASDDDDEEDKPLKKRRINGAVESGSEGEDNYDDEERERGRKEEEKGQDSVPGTPSDHPSEIPLPEKKTLELILDKLQKKDTYGVYAEPVDPEELPDYHDIIEHPMDFATVRNKLANGSYSTLEQFESDVFLICSNAMQYNAPDTVYHKQARAIEEQAKKKFHRLRVHFERAEREAKLEKELNKEKEIKSEKELKSEQKAKSNFLAKKQWKKPVNRAMQEPFGSDFSAGATLATAGDLQNGSVAIQAGGCERPSNTDGIVEGNSSLLDGNLEKMEELSSGKGFPSKLGRKLSIDENRRATYNISNQPEEKSESIFATFGSEIKQLVAVGLHAEYSYARSLARFAATLGPVAWKVASKRIEQALPTGYKFGRGWVGEYEPLPTPVLMLETTHIQKESAPALKLTSSGDIKKNQIASKTDVPSRAEGTPSLSRPVNMPKEVNCSFFSSAGTKPCTPVNPANLQRERNIPFFASAGTKPCTDPVNFPEEGSAQVFTSAGTKPCTAVNPANFPKEGSAPFFSSAGTKPRTPVNTISQQQNPFSRTPGEPNKKLQNEVELNLPSSTNQNIGDLVEGKQNSNNFETAPLKSSDMVSSTMKSLPSKQVTDNGGFPNEKSSSSSGNSATNQLPKTAATYFPHGVERGINDSVQLMKMFNERAQKQQEILSNQSPVHSAPMMPSVPSITRDDSNNAAAAAARAWMSIGTSGFKAPTEGTSSPKNQISAESLYNPTREFPSQISQLRNQFSLSAGMQFNGFPFQAFVPPQQPVRAVNEAQFQNRPPTSFPQLVTTDLSRFQQMQSPWRGLSPHNTQPRQKQKNEALPPDLNISFQSPGSPVKQSHHVAVDSQQPDLALQL